MALVALAGGLSTGVAVPAAAAYPYPDVSLVGHGWGPGEGMGQWGALGDALAGSSYQQILSTYYGTLADGGHTTVGSLPNGWSDTTPVTVAITENAGDPIVVTSGSTFTVSGVSGVFGTGGTASAAVVFQAAAPGTSNEWNVYGATGCGAASTTWTLLAQSVTAPTATPVTAAPFPASGDLDAQVLQLCQPGTSLSVRGSIAGTVNSDDQPRTVNVVPLGQYVADVTPSESPAGWGALGATGGQGQPLGFQALEAQAVAARSYVMSTYGSLQGYFGYADVCDSTCQSYPGVANENLITDAATTLTADTVVLMPGGSSVATTTYSSSTGGYTAAGTFAAVPDAGDAVCVPGACNAHHDWQAQVPVAAIDSAYPQIGQLVSVGVTARNGLGDEGGRVLDMTVQGTAGSLSVTGSAFAAQFSQYGVQSDWFALSDEASGGVAGYWMAAADGGIFAFGDAAFHGSMGGHRLAAPMVGMAPTPDGGGYWTVAADGGIFAYGDAAFHGSLGRAKLARPVVAMAPTPDGRGYWLLGADGGVFAFGDAPFVGSLPGSGVRATAVSIVPTVTGRGYLILTTDGRSVAFGDAPQFGDVATAVKRYGGTVVGGAAVAG